MKNLETAYRAITNPDGNIELSDLYKDDGSFYGEPALHFKNTKTEGFWDDSKYVKSLLKDLKSRKKSDKTKDLKKFCKEEKLDYKETKESLRSIYRTAKHLNFWNK